MNLSDIKNAVKNLSIAQMRELYEFISQEHNSHNINTHIQDKGKCTYSESRNCFARLKSSKVVP